MKEISMKVLKISGLIIQARMTSSLTRMNTKKKADFIVSLLYFLKISATFLGLKCSSHENPSSLRVSGITSDGGSITPSGF